MISRTYFAKLSSDQRAMSYLDICVQWTMGTRLAPVADPATFAGVTAPPAGWVAANGNGAYYEVRGRTLRHEHLFGEGAAAGFTERGHLGFRLSVVPYGNWQAQVTSNANLGGVHLSQSLLAAVGGDTTPAIAANNLADPVYGTAQPVIRIYAPLNIAEIMPTGLLLVCLDIAERKDEDFSNIGSP
jgi:hypothetical protein